MDEATQQNSALVEENAATSQVLEQQAKVMDEQVSFFQVDDREAESAGMMHPASEVRTVARPAVRRYLAA